MPFFESLYRISRRERVVWASMAEKKLPKRLKSSERAYLPKRARKSIHRDRIDPTLFRRLQLRFFCDDCSHYSASERFCTLGYRARHTRAEQLVEYELTGQMALCRAIEID